jgi:serine/threonine protein kinase
VRSLRNNQKQAVRQALSREDSLQSQYALHIVCKSIALGVKAPLDFHRMPPPEAAIRLVGRYRMFGELASGGMATVHLGHMTGEAGFSRVVAIKRMKPEVARQAEFVQMFRDEAQIAARVLHANVVTTIDVVSDGDELLIVMEYVRGLALKQLMELSFDRDQQIPVEIALSVIGGALEGLHAAHNVRGDHGEPLDLIHRDISPHNILVGRDGLAKIVDFGVAKAASRMHQTAANEVKGKLTYMAPERITRKAVDRRVDIFSMGVVLWEVLAGRKRYEGASVEEIASKLLTTDAPPIATERSDVPAALDRVIRRATARSPDERYATAEAMLTDLERSGDFASKRAVSAWVEETGRGPLEEHEELTRDLRAQLANEPAAAEEDCVTLIDKPSFDGKPEVGLKTTPMRLAAVSHGTRHAVAVSTVPMRALATDAVAERTRVMTAAIPPLLGADSPDLRSEDAHIEATQIDRDDELTRHLDRKVPTAMPRSKPPLVVVTVLALMVVVIATVIMLRSCTP